MNGHEQLVQAPHSPGSPWHLLDASRFLGVSHRHLVRLIDAGKVKTIRFGRRVFLTDAEVKRLATKGI